MWFDTNSHTVTHVIIHTFHSLDLKTCEIVASKIWPNSLAPSMLETFFDWEERMEAKGKVDG